MSGDPQQLPPLEKETLGRVLRGEDPWNGFGGTTRSGRYSLAINRLKDKGYAVAVWNAADECFDLVATDKGRKIYRKDDMKTIDVTGPYGELELILTPGVAVRVQAKGLFAIIDIWLRHWHREDSDASLVIARARQSRDKRADATVVLGQLAKRRMFPLQLFYEDTMLTFSTAHAKHPIEITVHHEGILP